MTPRIVAALRGEATDRPPIWFMRQAGRYLPEYMEVRSKVSFLELCRDADLAAEVTLQPVRRFGLDAGIVFSDILVLLEAMGVPIAFEKGDGPKILAPVRTRDDAARLVHPDVTTALRVPTDTIARFRAAMPEVPILGFAGAPWTLLCYLVEGEGSREWVRPKRLLLEDPALAEELLGKIADVVGDHLENQARAGAVAVQMFDTWAGALSPEDYRRFALPAAARAWSRVKSGIRIHYVKDSAPFLPWLRATGADVIGLDWRVELGAARRALGDVPVQGNLDPVSLFAPPDEIRRRVHAILEAGGGRGHVFNLGHGILPGTPVSGVEAMVDAVKGFKAAR